MILLRSIVFNIYFYGLTFILGLAGIVLRLLAPHRALDFACFWGRLSLAGLRLICGIRPQLIGAENLPASGPALIASQHQSAFDTLVWLTLVPRLAYVLKQELRRIPLFGPLLRPAGQIIVDRAAGAAALRSLLREGVRAFAAGMQVIIFPEGTRAAPGTTLPPHPGVAALAAASAMPVIPVATDSGRHWGRRAFLKRPGTVHILIAPALPAGLKRSELLERLRAAWEDGQCRLERVDNSVGDAALRQPPGAEPAPATASKT